MFEVGKKYKPRGFVGVIVTCVYIHPSGQAVAEWDHGRIGFIDDTWEEYIPPPPPKVKKEGWVIIYQPNPDYWGNTRPCTTSGVFPSEEAALVSFNESTITNKRAIAKVEWEE